MSTLTEAAPIVPTKERSISGASLNVDVVILCVAGALAVTTAIECKSITHLPSLLYGAALWGWWGCIASGLWRIGRRSPLLSAAVPKMISIQILIGSVLGAAHLMLLGSLGFTVAGWQTQTTVRSVLTSMMDLNRFGMELLLYAFLFGVTLVIQLRVRAQDEAFRALELKRQLSAAHLRTLQMQLEPHFLFNTLNAITTLVELQRTKEASEMLAHLNAILKSTLTRTTPEKVPLSQELEMVESYLAIEQVRFADRLRVEIKVEPGALSGLIPCFLLQPIVENAIRHGIANCESEGRIEASAKCDGVTLRLNVRDSGTGAAVRSHPGHGIGLSNTRERLSHFYQDRYAMSAEPLKTGGFEVAIAIPYERVPS